MKTMVADNEVFAIRDGESTTILEERPTEGRFIAVMARSVFMPDGPRSLQRRSDGAPVEMAAILSCQINTDGEWQWTQLSPPTKENIGDLLFDSGAEKDKWYYAAIK